MFKTAISAIVLAQLYISAVRAGVSFTNNDYYIHAGTPFTITWTDNRGSVTVTLMKGPDLNLEPVLVIVSGFEGNEYTWTPPATLPADSYELMIEDAGSVDYSSRFRYPAPPASASTPVAGGSAPTATSSASTATSTTATALPGSTSSPQPPLSTPAIAIIAALGSLLLIVLLALLVYCLVRRRRSKRHNAERAAAAAAAAATVSHQVPLSAVDTLTLRPNTSAAQIKTSDGSWCGYGSSTVVARAELPVRGWGDESVELASEGGRCYNY